MKFHLIQFRNEDVAELGKPNPLPEIEDCGFVPLTVALNHQPIVDHKYAYFHNDGEDVQEHPKSFVDPNNFEPNILCAGDECSDIDKLEKSA